VYCIGAAVDDRGWLLSIDAHLGAVLATDRISGERVIVSK